MKVQVHFFYIVVMTFFAACTDNAAVPVQTENAAEMPIEVPTETPVEQPATETFVNPEEPPFVDEGINNSDTPVETDENPVSSSSYAIESSSQQVSRISSNSVMRSSSSILWSSSSAAPTTGSFVDSRDGQIYKFVTIGNQVWMAENIRYTEKNNTGAFIGRCLDQAYGLIDKDCPEQGRFYKNQDTYDNSVNDMWTACPMGWHVPDTTEWSALLTAVGGATTAGKVLKSRSGWDDGGGDDAFGFGALSRGLYAWTRPGSWSQREDGMSAYFWSSVRNSDQNCQYVFVLKSGSESGVIECKDILGTTETHFFTVRCVKN